MNIDNRNYFQDFAWALPRAFKDPLAACRFEQGDTLYDTTRAYEGLWDEAVHHLKYSIQILQPIRGLKTSYKMTELSSEAEISQLDGVEKKSEKGIFTDNWNSTVKFDLTKFPLGQKINITTTQGRLYMMLWKGDISFIESGEKNVPVLRLSNEAQKDISDAEPFLLYNYSRKLKFPQLFIMPFDETNDILWTKYLRVKSILEKNYEVNIVLFKPDELNLPNIIDYVPTLRYVCFILDVKNRKGLFQHLKDALYVSTKNKKTQIDRFNLIKHGTLLPRE